MNSFKLVLALAVAVSFVLGALAAPAPSPESQGPISDAMRLRGKLPPTAAPVGMPVAVGENDNLIVQRVAMQYVLEQREVAVEVDGKVEKRVETVTRAVPVSYNMNVAAKDCKFYTVTKDGKLEAIDFKKAAPLLKKSTVVLTGDSSEVDPRHLEMVKAGTLYLVIPQRQVPTPLFDPPPFKGQDDKVPPLEKKIDR